MGVGSKFLLALNPISPANWITLLILNFTVKKRLEKNKTTKNGFIKWPLFFLFYFMIMIPIYYVVCAISAFLPGPLRLLSLFCDTSSSS